MQRIILENCCDICGNVINSTNTAKHIQGGSVFINNSQVNFVADLHPTTVSGMPVQHCCKDCAIKIAEEVVERIKQQW